MKAAELLSVGLALADDPEARGDLKSAGIVRALARAVVGAGPLDNPKCRATGRVSSRSQGPD